MGPIRFVFGLHLHQPVGNFDHVFAQHVEDVYRPLLDRLAGRGFLPVALHLSGPLLEWLESHEPEYLDRLGALAAEGKVEILLAGFYEPVLAALPRADRVEQIRWMHEAVQRRFGVEARGLWLTERVWEPELAADLVENGICMAGGGSLLRGLTNVVQKATGLDTRLADDPLTCVARGTCIYLEHLEEWKATLENDMSA